MSHLPEVLHLAAPPLQPFGQVTPLAQAPFAQVAAHLQDSAHLISPAQLLSAQPTVHGPVPH